MPKEGGLGHYLFVGGFDLSGDVGMVDSIMSSRAVLDVTAIDKSAVERISGIRDGSISFNAWYDPAALAEHPALSTLPTTDRLVQYHTGAVLGQNVACINAKQINYDASRSQDGALAFTIEALGNGFALEWGDQLTTGKQTFASATNGASIDYTVATTAFGAVGYLQVFSVGSGTATVAIQDSADNAAFANVTGLVFAGATGQTQERLATTTGATIRRYVRVNVTGSFTNAVIAVGFIKFAVAQS